MALAIVENSKLPMTSRCTMSSGRTQARAADCERFPNDDRNEDHNDDMMTDSFHAVTCFWHMHLRAIVERLGQVDACAVGVAIKITCGADRIFDDSTWRQDIDIRPGYGITSVDAQGCGCGRWLGRLRGGGVISMGVGAGRRARKEMPLKLSSQRRARARVLELHCNRSFMRYPSGRAEAPTVEGA